MNALSAKLGHAAVVAKVTAAAAAAAATNKLA